MSPQTRPRQPEPPAMGAAGWRPHWSTVSPWATPLPLASAAAPAPPALRGKPLTRLQLRSAPVVALALVASALAASPLPASVIIVAAYQSPRSAPLVAISLAVVVLFGLGLQALAFGPILWRLRSRKLVRHGRRWLVLAGLAAGFVEGGLMTLPYLLRNLAHPVRAIEVLLAFGGVIGLCGALGGLLFSLLATRRAPLETMFE